MRHNAQPQRVNASTMNTDINDDVIDDFSTLSQPAHRLQLMVIEINQARNKTKDPEIRLLFLKILRAGGVTVEV